MAGGNKHAILFSAVPLIAGISIYLLFRGEQTIVFSWLEELQLKGALQTVRAITLPAASHLPEWLLFNLPNGLWAFSYALIIVFIWYREQGYIQYLFFLTVPVLGLGYELMQYAGVIAGTFCPLDLSFCLAGIAAGSAAGTILKDKKGCYREKS